MKLRSLDNTFCGVIVGVSVLGGLGLLSGCSGNKVVGNQQHDQTPILIGDFRADPNAPTEPTPMAPAQLSEQTQHAQHAEHADHADHAGSDSNSEPGSPLLVAGSATEAPRTAIRSGDGGLEFLDAKVGDISGHPIYVSSFFEPIADRLIASGKENKLPKWRNDAIKIVENRLKGIIYDELLRAETLAALTPKQRVGLQSYLNNFRSNILSQNVGSKELANRRLLEDQGITLDQALRQKELDTLVGLTLHEEINRRINISWRDIKQRYERDIKRFQPPPTVVLKVIRVREPEGELVDSITNRLNSGESFAEIASSDTNTFNRDTQGTIETELEDDFQETKFFPPDVLNEAVWPLSVGQWAGPIAMGNSTFWIMYAELRQESTSLYEAQIQLSRELTQERRNIEQARFLTELIERARVSSQDEILLRLLYIAEKLYGPTG